MIDRLNRKAEFVFCVFCKDEDPELQPGAGDPQAQFESERAEDAEPTGVRAPLL